MAAEPERLFLWDHHRTRCVVCRISILWPNDDGTTPTCMACFDGLVEQGRGTPRQPKPRERRPEKERPPNPYPAPRSRYRANPYGRTSPRQLTMEEVRLVLYYARSGSIKAVAYEFGVSYQTIKNRLTMIYRRLGAESGLQAVYKLLEPPELSTSSEPYVPASDRQLRVWDALP